MRLDHCCLNVCDLDASIDFYQQHFGMKLLSRKEIPENNAEIAFVGYEQAGMKLELTEWKDWDEEDHEAGNNFDHIAVTCPDVKQLFNQLTTAGVEPGMEPFELSTGSHIAFVKDVDENGVELVEET
jgi:lactoylglutathione lyase